MAFPFGSLKITSLLRGHMRANALLLRPELRGELGTEVLGLEHLANLDLGKKLLVRQDARFRVLRGFDHDHESHRDISIGFRVGSRASGQFQPAESAALLASRTSGS